MSTISIKVRYLNYNKSSTSNQSSWEQLKFNIFNYVKILHSVFIVVYYYTCTVFVDVEAVFTAYAVVWCRHSVYCRINSETACIDAHYYRFNHYRACYIKSVNWQTFKISFTLTVMQYVLSETRKHHSSNHPVTKELQIQLSKKKKEI